MKLEILVHIIWGLILLIPLYLCYWPPDAFLEFSRRGPRRNVSDEEMKRNYRKFGIFVIFSESLNIIQIYLILTGG